MGSLRAKWSFGHKTQLSFPLNWQEAAGKKRKKGREKGLVNTKMQGEIVEVERLKWE